MEKEREEEVIAVVAAAVVAVAVAVAVIAVEAAAAAVEETKWLLAHKELSVRSRASPAVEVKSVQVCTSRGLTFFFDRQTDSRLLSLLRCNFFRPRAHGFEAEEGAGAENCWF